MKKLLLPLSLILLLAAGCNKNTTSNASSDTAAEPTKYTNTAFGYSVSYKSPWRIAQDYSNHQSIVKETSYLYRQAGCTLDSQEQYQQYVLCTQDKTKASQVQPQLDSFQQNWSAQNSDYIVVTDLDQNTEQGWIASSNQASTSAVNIPAGHAIEIYPLDTAPNITKESPANSKSKILIKIITLSSGVKAQQIDSRGLGISGSLVVTIPINKSWAKGLALKTTAQAGSSEEQEFNALANSLVFN